MSQFTNASHRPVEAHEYRERLQKLVNAAPSSNGDVQQHQLKSWVVERHQQEMANRPVKHESYSPKAKEAMSRHLVSVEKETYQHLDRQMAQVRKSEKLANTEEVVAESLSQNKKTANSQQVVESAKAGSDVTQQVYPQSSWSGTWHTAVRGSAIKVGESEKVILEIRMPQTDEVEPSAAEQMFSSLVSLGEKVGFVSSLLSELVPKIDPFLANPQSAMSFEIAADHHSVAFWVVVPKDWAEYVEKQIHGAYPNSEIDAAKADDFLSAQGSVVVKELGVKGKLYEPIKTYVDFEVDPLNALTSAVSQLLEDERVIMQMLIQPADNAWRKSGQRFLQEVHAEPKEGKKKSYTADVIVKGVEQKISKPGYRVALRVLAQSSDTIAAETLMHSITRSFDQFSQPQMSSFQAKSLKSNEELMKSFLARTFPKRGSYPILNTQELATIYHFPGDAIKTPRINWLRSRKSAPPTNMPSKGLYLGKSEYRNESVPVRVQRKDRQRHQYIIGQTGSGKSELLKFMAYQDIMNGEGVAFIDPHGEAVEDLLAMIPKERAEDVIYFNAADTKRPMAINILEAETEEAKHQAVNSFIGLLYKLYDPNHTGIVGPQLERAVRNTMLTAMGEQGNTMIEVLKLITNPRYAEKKIANIKDPMVKSYWTEQMAQTSDFHRSETLGYFVSKFDRFVTEKLMRNIIGQPRSSFNMREIMDKQKILLVNLSKGMIGEENSSFLGLLLVPRILTAAMSRADMPQEERKDFYLYVDEFQNFSTPDFAQILAEARKYRLNLIVANQYISQIQDEIKDAVFGNVGTTTSFRVGVEDAEYLQKQFEPVFDQNDLINLSIGECVTRMLIDGQPSAPFSFHTDWDLMQKVPSQPQLKEIIKEMSRLKYGKDRTVIEQEIDLRTIG